MAAYPKLLLLRQVSKAAFVSLLAAALAIRLILTATSFGSTDALLLMAYTHLAERYGIGPAYHLAPYLNHPPLSGWIMMGADRLGSRLGLEFPDVFRLFQTLADLISAAILFKLGSRYGRSREFAAFFFCSPAAIFLSGFHCNSDPTMMALLLASVLTGSGLLFGAASGIKIAPLPLAPFFLIHLSWLRRVIFLVSALALLAAIFIPAVATGGTTVLRNVFLYPGSGYEWGFCGIGYLLNSHAWAQLYAYYGRYIVVVALACLFVFYWRRPAQLPTMIGVALLTMNFFSPAFGVQYLVWPLPFFLFALSRRMAYVLNVALSLFLFATYTIWAREFPWWFADAAAPNPQRPLIALLAIPLWLLYGVAIVAALRRQPANELPAQ
jgi:hypothetical protein